MNGWQERYWLVERGHHGPVSGERRAEDFVCCEVRVGEDAALALEVFTSRGRAEAEFRGMERLSSGEHYPRAASKYRGRLAEEEPDERLYDSVVEVAPDELVEMLGGSGVPYVLVDPPPIDEPIPEGLLVEPAAAFTEGLGRWLPEEMKKGRT